MHAISGLSPCRSRNHSCLNRSWLIAAPLRLHRGPADIPCTFRSRSRGSWATNTSSESGRKEHVLRESTPPENALGVLGPRYHVSRTDRLCEPLLTLFSRVRQVVGAAGAVGPGAWGRPGEARRALVSDRPDVNRACGEVLQVNTRRKRADDKPLGVHSLPGGRGPSASLPHLVPTAVRCSSTRSAYSFIASRNCSKLSST